MRVAASLSAHRRFVQRLAIAVTQGELPGAANLLRKRSPCGRLRLGERTKSRAGTPRGETNRHQCEDDGGGAVTPHQRQQRWVVVLGQEVHFVCRTQLCRGHEQPAVIAGQSWLNWKWCR